MASGTTTKAPGTGTRPPEPPPPPEHQQRDAGEPVGQEAHDRRQRRVPGEAAEEGAGANTSAAKVTIETWGVRKRACTRANAAGRSPRSAIENSTRGDCSTVPVV